MGSAKTDPEDLTLWVCTPKPSQTLFPSAEVTHPHFTGIRGKIIFGRSQLPPFGVGLQPLTSTAPPGCSGEWEQAAADGAAPAQVWRHLVQSRLSPQQLTASASQQRCYQRHWGWTKKSRWIAVKLTKGNFAVQNTARGDLQCSSSRPIYLMKQQHSGFHVICTFC